MLDMAMDSASFHNRDDCEAQGFELAGNVFVKGSARRLPLYEAKMIHQFDHRFGTYDGQTQAQSNKGFLPQLTDDDHADPNHAALPYYWVDDHGVDARLAGRWSHSWLLGWRDITMTHQMRTVIAAAIPRVGANDKFLLMLPGATQATSASTLLTTLSSLVFDYCARQKLGGSSLKYFVMRQLPVVPPSAITTIARWDSNATIGSWLTPRAVELVYTAYDMTDFARDCGYVGPPFLWDPERRAILRAELDAAFFHLYGLDRSDTEYVLGTFPVLRDKEIARHGEYRTQRLVLERYDALATAISTSTPAVTPLAPPPADPRVAHPASQEA